MGGRILYPNGKPCKCGCKQPAERNIVNGINKGWTQYAKGHQPPPALCDPKVREKARLSHRKTIPVGTRRLQRASKGRYYWVVKTEEDGKWPLEHRHVMEQMLGRKLLTEEIVHHIDNDGLNNDPENLEITDQTTHVRHHSKNRKPTCECKCPSCGKTLRHFAKGVRLKAERGSVHALQK